ncbi:myosin-10 isoform X2 [Seriola aureovittata]|uniref:myosin-10 isoform X2 n=1 Tax=Seriola aureovittata TaxID=2871759 RepID=UPI0024BD72A3|nr:myosin-10 isoform X2 [Seriola aureovittata]
MRQAMAGGSHFIWIPLLLSCIVQASDNTHVQHAETVLVKNGGISELDKILSRIPITLPDGIDPKNVNVTSITIKSCSGMKEQLALLNRQLQQTTLHNSQLDEEAFGLRREVRQLRLKLATCTSTTSTITISYQTQLQNKVKEELEKFDSDTFLVLKILALTREVKTLENRIKLAANSSEITTGPTELQRELQEKVAELNAKQQQIEGTRTNSELILQIISLQNQIWDVEQEVSRRGETGLQHNSKIIALQQQLDRKISELQRKEDETSSVLELTAVSSKIAAIEKLITFHTEKSSTSAADYQRQIKEKTDLLKKKILQLNRDERNTDLTNEILTLQAEMLHIRQIMSSSKTLSDARLKELKSHLDAEKRRQENLEKQLGEVEPGQSQQILNIITLMKELRELNNDEQQQTTPINQLSRLQTLLQAKERDYAKAQADIKELQGKLELKSKECSGLEERYANVKTEFEQKIAELNRTGDSKAALVLNVINLHDELRTLTDLISRTQDPDSLSELQKQLEEKQEQLHSMNAQIKELIANPKIILTIIELQSEIWDLQNKGTNETTSDRIKELQSRVDSLISDIDGKGNKNTKLMLRIMMLQNQVEQMQRQLSDVNSVKSTQVTQLENDLDTKKNELQRYVNELKEKNQENAELILSITGLNNQLRQLQEEKQNEGQKTSASITKLREQLKIKAEEHSRDQDTIKALESKLNQTEAQCSSHEQEIKKLQSDLDENMKKLESESDSVTTLALQVSTLTMQLEELQKQLQKTESKAKIKELQAEIEEKNKELAKKTEELKTRSTQPQRLLQIITIQTEIEKYMNAAANDTDYVRITALQDHLNYLVEGIQDEKDENTKLVFQLLTQQDEIARLKKQEDNQRQALLDKIKALEDELDDVRRQIAEKSQLLESHDMRIPNLSAEIIALHQRIKPLEDEISTLNETYAENMAELQARLTLTQKQLQDSELRLKDTDAKNFNSIMEIADLRAQLKKAQKKASKAAEKNINDLELQLQLQQKANKKLEITNRDLQQEVKELKMCCNEANTHCEDLKRQLQQSQEDADRLQRQLRERDAAFKQLQQDFKDKTEENEKLQSENSNKPSANLQQQLQEKDALVKQLQQQVDQRTADNHRLQDDYDNLQNEKNDLESRVQDLQDKLTDVEDKTIHISKMTFDPNTAHPRIYLSTDKTEMSTTEEILVRDNPNRFDVVLAALGKSGFSSGRHYWEVSVAGKLCYHIGMSSESAPRKGSFPFSPTNGYWTIVMNKQGQHRALDKRPVSISITTQPLQLGVLLDYKAGQISFYDSGARTHMYTFVGQKFTDKIHPFINYCVDEVENPAPIVLLNPGSADWIK